MALFKEHLYAMGTYKPPLAGRSAQSQLLLDFNERTLPLGQPVIDALQDYINAGSMQKYPSYEGIVEQLADYMHVSSDQVMITNGSDQGIDLIARATLNPGDIAVVPEPTFAMYRQAAEVEAAHILSPGYDIDTGYPIEEVLRSVTSDTRLIVVPLPNNPTGTAVSADDLERILRSAPEAVVLVDECYYEYCGQTALNLIDRHPNLVVVRTFSKTWGLPSLRFGCVVSQSTNIDQLLKIRGPYDVNQLAVVAAEAALKHPGYTDAYVKEVVQESKPLLEQWFRERNIVFWPSQANFLWAFPPRAADLEIFLRNRDILVRPKYNEENDIGLRVTLGTQSQTKHLIDVMEEFYQ